MTRSNAHHTPDHANSDVVIDNAIAPNVFEQRSASMRYPSRVLRLAAVLVAAATLSTGIVVIANASEASAAARSGMPSISCNGKFAAINLALQPTHHQGELVYAKFHLVEGGRGYWRKVAETAWTPIRLYSNTRYQHTFYDYNRSRDYYPRMYGWVEYWMRPPGSSTWGRYQLPSARVCR